jgi:hypothetical protein
MTVHIGDKEWFFGCELERGFKNISPYKEPWTLRHILERRDLRSIKWPV